MQPPRWARAVGPPFPGNLRTIYPVLNQQVSATKIHYQDWTMALTLKELLGDHTKYFGLYDDFLFHRATLQRLATRMSGRKRCC